LGVPVVHTRTDGGIRAETTDVDIRPTKPLAALCISTVSARRRRRQNAAARPAATRGSQSQARLPIASRRERDVDILRVNSLECL
jgi:hypothetical protein